MGYLARLAKYLPAGLSIVSALARQDPDRALRTLRKHELALRDKQQQRIDRLRKDSGERSRP